MNERKRLFPDRVYTVLPGLLVLRCICKTVGTKQIMTSKYGVREGYLIEKVLNARYEKESRFTEHALY